VIAVFRTELAKQLRRPRTYVALTVAAVIPVVIAVAVKSNPPTASGGGEGRALFFLGTQSGLVLGFAALRLMSRFLLIVIVALFAGDAIAGEAGTGNLRYLLVRPIARGRLLAGKLAVAVLLVFVAATVIAGAASIAGGVTFGWHPVALVARSSTGFGAIHHSVGALIGYLAATTLYIAWTMTVVAAFAFMLSTLTDSPTAAISGGVGLFVVSQILDSIDSIGRARDFLPTAYLDSWDHLLFDGTVSDSMVRGMLIPIPYLAVFCTVAWWWFRRKDVLS
jgi:ABC-2 type transport system permease protein